MLASTTLINYQTKTTSYQQNSLHFIGTNNFVVYRRAQCVLTAIDRYQHVPISPGGY